MELVTVLGLLVTFLVGILVKDYLPGYVRKKGENLATKEDIAAITKQVESVKFALNQQAKLLSTKQQLLMRFYDEVTVLYFERFAVNFGDFPADDGKSLFEYQQTFYKSVAELMKAYQRLVIFLPQDSSLLKVSEEIVNCAVQARKVFRERFGKVKLTFIDEHQAYLKGDPAGLSVAAQLADKANSAFWNEMSPHVEAMRTQYFSFLGEMNLYVNGETS